MAKAGRSRNAALAMAFMPLDARSALEHLRGVLDDRRALEAMPDAGAPFLEIGTAAEIDRVVLDGIPLHEQPVAARLLDRLLQREAAAALGALEHRRGLGDAGLEVLLHAGLDVDLRDFGDQGCFGAPCCRPAR